MWAKTPAPAAVRGYPNLQAHPLVEPDLRTPIGFMTQRGPRVSRALESALGLLDSDVWKERLSGYFDSLPG